MTTTPAVRPSGPVGRVVRSVLVGLTVAGCAATAHLGAAGHVSVEAVAGVGATSTLVALALSGRRLTTGQLLGLLVLGQAALHLLGSMPGEPGQDVRMLLAHTLATSLSLVAIRGAEDAWWRLADAVLRRLPVLRLVAAPVAVPALVVGAPERARASTVVLSVGGRAPPVGR